MRLLPLSIGYVRLGWNTWSGDFGLDWGFGREPTRFGDRYFRYRRYGNISFVSREAWQDFGWWALWPAHFCRQTLGNYDPEVCDWRGDTAIFKPYTPSWRWTGRRSVVVGMTLTLFGYRWFVRLP